MKKPPSRSTNFILLPLLALALSNCGKRTDRDVPNEDPDLKVSGKLSKVVKDLYDDGYTDSCDISERTIRMKVSKALDAKQDFIEKSSTLTARDGEPVAFHGSYLINEPKKNPDPKNDQTFQYSWKIAHRLYQEILRSPGAQTEKWVQLNTYVRGILLDDRNRAGGVNYMLKKQHIKLIPALITELKACQSNPKCADTVIYSPEVGKMVFEVPFYRYFDAKFTSEKDPDKKEDILNRYIKRVEYDHFMRDGLINDSVTVRKTDKGVEMSVPFTHPGFSETDQETIKKAIESEWKSDGRYVSLKFLASETTPQPFRIFFDRGALGSRAFVRPTKREMHLNPFTTIRAIAHEFGHVLGIDDHYHTEWDSEKCVYTTQANTQDIMSDHTSGSVTKETWDQIEKMYPVK